jgi:hypothetical protein
MEADDTTVATCDDVDPRPERARQVPPRSCLTARPRDLGTNESEAQYKDALATMFDAAACVDIVVCADGRRHLGHRAASGNSGRRALRRRCAA